MKIFKHLNNDPILADLPKEEIDGRRFYITPSGQKLPSVTTFLSSFKKENLIKWEKRVGLEEAARVKTVATNRGKAFHALMECYLKNELDPIWANKNLMPDLLHSYQKMIPILDNVDNIHYVESMLYSETLGLAGQADLIAEYNSIPSIIDFKTSTRQKPESWIEDYFLQCTAYSLMYEDMTGIKAKQIVILISVDHDHPQCFIRNRSDYVEKLYGKIIEFRKTKIS